MKTAALVLLLIFVAAALPSLPANAYEYRGYKWEDADLPVTYRINPANRPAWLTTDSFIAVVQGGFQAWNDVACSDMEFRYGGSTTATKSRERTNAVYWNPTGEGMGSNLAATWIWTNFNGDRLYDVDMEINGAVSWSISGETDKYDLQSVITHEAGHYLSLADLYAETDREKTMYGTIYPGEVGPRTLSADDAAGICYLYPANALAFLAASLPKALTGIPYNQQLQTAGGRAPYAWQVTSGTLPPGLQLNPATGWISGTPSQTGNFTFTVRITDAAFASLTRTYTIQAAASRQPDIFGYEVGNRTVETGTSTTEGSYTETWDITAVDQTTFSFQTYVAETRRNGVLQGKSWEQRKDNELWGWGAEIGGDFYKFASGLLEAWYPMYVGDHRYSLSSVIISAYPTYTFYTSLAIDVVAKEDLTTSFGTLPAYKLSGTLRIWGNGLDQTETSYEWFVPYIGSVKHESSKETELVQSFVIGGGTITQDTDADADGLKDWQELVTYNTDWLKADTDQDGLHDAEELKRGTDPKKDDTDGDGLKDGWEVRYGFAPLAVNNAQQDPDHDGLTNLQEQAYGTNPLLTDTDSDGLSDAAEIQRGTNPAKADTDGDGLKDGWEILYGFDPLSTNDAAADPDKDGLTNLAEQGFGTNPLLPDEDGDGCSDSVEIMARRNPKAADREGDLNGDCYIDLRDLVLALQISSGMASSSVTIHRENDVNHDQKINLMDAIYILQRIAGVRSGF